MRRFVRTALAYCNKPQTIENRDDFARFENRNGRHSVDDDGLRTNELGFELRFAVIKQHCDHFSEIGVQLVERGALAVRSGKTRNVAHVQVRFGTAFNDGGLGAHGSILTTDVGSFYQSRKGFAARPRTHSSHISAIPSQIFPERI